MQRTDTGEMTGAQCHGSLTSLYDVAGQIRASYIELQKQARLALQQDD